MIDATLMSGNKVILNTHLSHHSKWSFPDNTLSAEEMNWLDADLQDEVAESAI